MSNIARLSDYRDDRREESDASRSSRRSNELYTGGASSGISVVGGSSVHDRTDDDRDQLQSILKRAKRTQRTEENEDGHEIEASNSRSVITLYRNGFVVDGGPFRPNEGSANKRFLRDLSRGVCPGELEEGGEPRVVEIKDRHTEDFRKPSYVAFGGDGHTLAAPSNATALAPGSDKDDDDLTGKPIQIRDGEPTVRVQIQLHDRRREIVVCHKSTTVRELWRHVVSLTPGIKFVLLQGYPPKPIDGAKFDVSIGDAGLAGARVMQRKT